ncbi:MAG: ORF6N domain-containing protein [Saprospiraceae bacterium]
MEIQLIQQKIHELRGQKVMLDFDLAALFGVENRVLKQSVRRNMERFPGDFMFELTQQELKNLTSQFVMSSWGGTRHLPFAFTEHGVAMLASILNSPQAIQMNIAIIRAFVALRHYALTYKELAQKLTELESKQDRQFADINDVLNFLAEENQARANEIAALQNTPKPDDDWQNRQRIGFNKQS